MVIAKRRFYLSFLLIILLSIVLRCGAMVTPFLLV